MKIPSFSVPLLLAMAWLCALSRADAQTSAFSYQGQLLEDSRLANGTYDLRFSLWKDPSGTAPEQRVGAVYETNRVRVNKGAFSVVPDFGVVSFGQDLWLELEVRVSGAATYNPPLRPRQAVLSSPSAQFALRSGTATRAATADRLTAGIDSSALLDLSVTRDKLAPGAVNSDKLESGAVGESALANNAVTTAKLAVNSVGTLAVADGSLTPTDLNMGLFGAAVWLVTGNAGTSPGTHFLGTTDAQPLEFRVNNQRGWLLQAGSLAPNLVGGAEANSIGSVSGSVIVGGGSAASPNSIGASDFATIGGGEGNSISDSGSGGLIAGGARNTIEASAVSSVIGGGEGNTVGEGSTQGVIAGGGNNGVGAGTTYVTISGGLANGIESAANFATVAGGANNVVTASSVSAPGGITISGGRNNLVRGDAEGATIGGGARNTIEASGRFATVPGGSDNAASGSYSLAVGRQAKANHTGAFVWADAAGLDFSSLLANEFAVRATGGVRLETGGAGLRVDGSPVLFGAVSTGQIGNSAVTLDKLADGAVTTAKVADGTLTSGDLNLASFDTTFWRLGGNSISDVSTQFLGTLSAQPLDLVVNAQRAARLAPDGAGGVNVILGEASNNAQAGAASSIIGGGSGNSLNARHAIIAGGEANLIQAGGIASVISGGANHRIAPGAEQAVIAGGGANLVNDNAVGATIGGGRNNRVGVGAANATIPGGSENSVAGPNSFAAGKQAVAAHVGAFVWSDSQGSPFTSSAANEFAVRAGGGVRLETANVGVTLDGATLRWTGAALQVQGASILTAPVGNADLSNSSVTVTAGRGLTGGGAVALGGAITLDVNATNASVASSIVQRDLSGDFEANSITLTGGLHLPATSSPAQGVLTLGGAPFLHGLGGGVLVGVDAGNFAMTGALNTYVGRNAGRSTTTGFHQVAVGTGALGSNLTGFRNTAVGLDALSQNEFGANNVAVGAAAGNLVNGDNNIAIGNEGVAGESNTIWIGSIGSAQISPHTSTYIAGIAGSVAPAGTAVLVAPDGKMGTIVSSRRFKDDIRDMDQGSDVVNALRPVRFHYKPELDPKAVPQFGLVAEEVETVAPELVVHDAEGKPYSVRYEAVNAMLLNEFQKAQRRADAQARKVDEQERSLADLREQVQRLTQQLAALAPANVAPTPASAANASASIPEAISR